MCLLTYQFQVQHVNLVISCVKTENAFLQIGYVMGLLTALMVQTKTKRYVLHVPTSFSAQMANASIWKMFVTEKVVAVTAATKIKSVSVS